jgi:2,4-dienoyl-CoA reductase-like NADH-dependent reductase (Old Yellow Enzyme family)
MTTLFQPLPIGSLERPGRVIKSATHDARCHADGSVSDELTETNRARRAEEKPTNHL